MCVEKVQAFKHGGKLFDTEIQAQEAALASIAAELSKEHSANYAAGLEALSDKLIPVLTRLSELKSDKFRAASAVVTKSAVSTWPDQVSERLQA